MLEESFPGSILNKSQPQGLRILILKWCHDYQPQAWPQQKYPPSSFRINPIPGWGNYEKGLRKKQIFSGWKRSTTRVKLSKFSAMAFWGTALPYFLKWEIFPKCTSLISSIFFSRQNIATEGWILKFCPSIWIFFITLQKYHFSHWISIRLIRSSSFSEYNFSRSLSVIIGKENGVQAFQIISCLEILSNASLSLPSSSWCSKVSRKACRNNKFSGS